MSKRFPLLVGALVCAATSAFAVEPAPNGITLPEGYRQWQVLAVHQRSDNTTLRAVLGNEAAVKAVREGRTNPWPDGAVLGKLVWKGVKHDRWETALAPGDFVHAEFMVKDSAKYPATGGWGFARWVGMAQKPYGADANFVQECFNCHQPVKDRDFVFTHPAQLP